MKVLGIIIGILVVLIVAVLVFTDWRSDTVVPDTQEQPEVENNEPEVYQSDDLEFSILIPEEATATEAGSDRVEIKYLGPQNEPGTEIADGYIVTIVHDPLSESLDPASYAESVFEESQNRPEYQITEPLSERTVNGQTVYQYSFINAIGSEVTEYLYQNSEGDVGYRITSGIFDPNDQDYERIVQLMLESFETE